MVNRPNSQDSRFFGTVTTADIEAVWSSTLPAGATKSDLPSLNPDDGATVVDTPASTAGPVDYGLDSACKASKTAIATALEAYYSKEARYPDHLQQLMDVGFVSDFGGTLDQFTDTITGPAGGDGTAFELHYVKRDDNSFDLSAPTC